MVLDQIKWFSAILIVLCLSIPAICQAGSPAPFTVDANNKILEIVKNSDLDKLLAKTTADPYSDTKKIIELLRAIYNKAGYDFDATIRAVATYLRKSPHPESEFNNPNLLHTPFQGALELLWVLRMKSEDAHVDIFQFFDQQTSESIKHIISTIGLG